MLSGGNTPKRLGNGVSSGSSRRPARTSILRPESADAITSMNPCSKGRCDRPCAKQGSPSPRHAIPSDIMPGPALPALVCHNPTRKRLRHSHDPGTSRTLRRKYDDVHPRTQPRGPLRAQPSGLRRAPESTLPIVAATQRHTGHYRYRLSALPASIIVLPRKRSQCNKTRLGVRLPAIHRR